MNPLKPFRHMILGFTVLALAACGGGDEPAPQPLPAVEFQAVRLEAVANVFEFVARTRAREDTAIRARVTGNVIERNFNEGQLVEEGTLLFRIDPRPYEAALNAARADLSRTVTALEVAQRNLARGEELSPQGFISESELDKLRGERDGAIAAKSAAEAALEQAEINLDFTEIRAPFTGTAGRSQLSIGDLADPSAGALVTLVQRDPMLVDFDVDEQSLARAMNENKEKIAGGSEPQPWTVRLKLVTGDFYALEGEIDYASNRVNPSTGTVTITARFPNPENVLIPGQFVRVVLHRGEGQMKMLIPQPAVLEDMQGRYVFVVDDSDTVVRKNVTLGQRSGIDWVVESGLAEGDRVIVNGIQKVRAGMPVSPSPVGAQPHGKPETP